MMEEIYMNKEAQGRMRIFLEIAQKKTSQVNAAKELGLSDRHVRRLYAAFRKDGVIALKSNQCFKPSNNQLPPGLQETIEEIITCERYVGFRPTFMREKLQELHGIKISVETTRKLMIKCGIWVTHKKKSPVIHQQRKRRARAGELVQIDGSPHAWFEDRGDPCVLIVFIDDATGQTYGRFFKTETTIAYMETAWRYFNKYGLPQTFYPDRYSVFRVNRKGCLKKQLITQFGRVCKELNIELICAKSPQAKGRVERKNQTLQDRLVKELRLAGISNMEEGNLFLDNIFWDKHNKQFAKDPECKQDAHRKLLPTHDLERILAIKNERTVSKNLEVTDNHVIYQITQEKPSWRLRNARVTVIKTLKGQVYIEHRGKNLPFKIYGRQEASGNVVDSKEIDRFLKETKSKKVPYNHPWNQEGRAAAKLKQYEAQLQRGCRF